MILYRQIQIHFTQNSFALSREKRGSSTETTVATRLTKLRGGDGFREEEKGTRMKEGLLLKE